MKPSLTVLLLSCLPILCFAQEPNILFQGLHSKSHIESLHLESLESRVRTALINHKRINIITRDSTFWQSLRKELEAKDFIDEKTAVQLGNLSGASHYLDGVFVRYVTDSKTERSSDGVARTTYNAAAELSLSLVNLESGKYEVSFAAQKSVWASSPDEARLQVFNELIDEMLDKISKYYPIRASVTSVNSQTREVEFNKGSQDGVVAQATYVLSNDKTVVMKVTHAGSQSSTARLLSGSVGRLQPGQEISESFEDGKNTVRVVRVKDRIAFLDAGKNLALKKGDMFVLRKEVIVSMNSPVYEEEFPAAVIVSEVKDDFAKARIAKGFADISEGVELVVSDERESVLKRTFIFAGYKIGIAPRIKANTDNGIVTVSNDDGDFEIATNYNDSFEDITSVKIISLGFGSHSLYTNFSKSLNIDIYDIGDGKLKNWIGHFDAVYTRIVKEKKFYIYYGGGLGFAGMKQKVPANVIETISSGKSTEAKTSTVFASAKTGFTLMTGPVGLSLSCSYDFLKYQSWECSGKEGSVDVPATILPYPVVNLSGLYVTGSLAYYFGK